MGLTKIGFVAGTEEFMGIYGWKRDGNAAGNGSLIWVWVKIIEPIKHQRIGCLYNKIQGVNIGKIFESLDEKKTKITQQPQKYGYINPRKDN